MARKLPHILTNDQRTRLLAAPNPRYASGRRNRAMLALMLDTGLRAGELVALRCADVDLQTGDLWVRQGKGSKDRRLAMGVRTVRLLEAWLEGRDSGNVFLSRTDRPLSTAYLRQMCARYGERIGLPFRLHPHTLRHTFASDLYRYTGNLVVVQHALGHESAQTTLIYTHLVDGETEEAMRKFREPAESGALPP